MNSESNPERFPKPKKMMKRIKSEVLLDHGHEIIIEHGDEEYRLRLTKSGKLILTK